MHLLTNFDSEKLIFNNKIFENPSNDLQIGMKRDKSACQLNLNQ